jgi:hypothetical protein
MEKVLSERIDAINESSPANWTGSERKTFAARVTESKQRRKWKALEDGEMKLLTPKAAFVIMYMFHRNTF